MTRFGGGGAGAGGLVAVVLGESLVLMVVPEAVEWLPGPGTFGEFGVFGGLSGKLSFLF